MNCKFCGNFIPDNTDTCPVCGRRQDERPIGELLSENMPNPIAAEEQRDDLKRSKNADSSAPAQKKSLISPLIAVALAVVGWFYGLSQNVWETIKTIFNGSFGQGASLASDSDFVAGSSSTGMDLSALGLVGIVVIVLTLIGVIGLIILVKRLIGNLKK